MTILKETAQQVKDVLGLEFDTTTVERVVIGVFFTGVKLSNGAGGISYTPVKDIPQAVCCPSSAGRIFDPLRIKNMKVSDVLAELSSKEPLKVSVAIATLNALSACCWDRGLAANYLMREDADALDAVRIPGRNSVAVIGAFVPVLKKLKDHEGMWWVIEQDLRTLKSDEIRHFIPAENSKETIAGADVLIVTGLTLLNHTLEDILKVARQEAEIAVIGPTASMLPDAMFARGVRVVGGVLVKKPDELLDVLAAGGSGYHFFGSLAPRIVIENQL